MEREVTSNYSLNTSRSDLSDQLATIHNLIRGSSNSYNMSNNFTDIFRYNFEEENWVQENNQETGNNVSNSARQQSRGTVSSNTMVNVNFNENNVQGYTNNRNSYEYQTINNINSEMFDLINDMSQFSTNNLLTNSNASQCDYSEEPYYSKVSRGRAATAPVRSLNDPEEFRWSTQFNNLERAVIYSNRLIILKPETKFDVDSEEGMEVCKKFLEHLEKLIKSLKVNTTSRDYRKDFSSAYKYLYQEGNLCYLTEILDSAQEGTPSLWVNGEKYSFSKEVLENGSKLYNIFCKLLVVLRDCYQKARDNSFFEDIKFVKTELKKQLEEFDKCWVAFEHKYISELINIENESRRFIIQGIKIERELTTFEVRAKARGRILLDSDEYNKIRDQLVMVISEINKVANVEGKGRDDLTLNILTTAEGVLRKVSNCRSKSVRRLAENIKRSFLAMRKLFKKYDDNIDMVNPQLKSNPELTECLFAYEQAWEKGKEYLLNIDKYAQLMFFSQMIEVLCEKYKEINEQLESRDPNIFVWIPSILLLKCLDNEDSGICREFNPEIFKEKSGAEPAKLFSFLRDFKDKLYCLTKDPYKAYNILEQVLLFEEDDVAAIKAESEIHKFVQKDSLKEFKRKIKILAMQLQRVKPTDWNNFFNLAMNL